MRRRVALVAAATLTVGVTVPVALADHGPEPAVYLVGGGVESINPPLDMLDNGDFYLGGYGFGSGKVANQVAVPGASDLAGRAATGILADGVHSRAFAVSDGKATTVLAQIETQGYFDAYKQGPFGLNEIRQDAAAAIARLAAGSATPAHRGGGGGRPPLAAPPPTASQIVVDSDHTHGGPDTPGVWGGVPTAYLELVHDRTVAAIVDAWSAMRPATLSYGVAHAGVNDEAEYPPQECINAGDMTCMSVQNPDRLLNNQFSYDPANRTMDDEVRVLQARDPHTGKVLDTYVNYSSHPTVLGSSNTLITADYVGRLDDQMQAAFGGFAMDQVATLGREQPAREDCPQYTGGDANPDEALCKLDRYAARVLVKVKEALALATPLTGTPLVAMNSYLMADPTTSGVLAGITYAGSVIGVPAGRAANPPWYTGTLLGTTYYVGRIGDILVTGGPGEMYAQIWQKVKDVVMGDKTSGITSVLNIGTAGDFLGYIIAPLEAYPEPARRSMFDGSPPPTGNNCSGVQSPVGCPSPIDNDNYFFNVSHTFGERLTCDFLRGAGDIVKGDATVYWSRYDRCPAFANDVALPPGTDMQFPQQPDLSGVLTHM